VAYSECCHIFDRACAADAFGRLQAFVQRGKALRRLVVMRRTAAAQCLTQSFSRWGRWTDRRVMGQQLEQLAFESLARRYLCGWVQWSCHRGPALAELRLRRSDTVRRHFLGVWRRWMERGLRAEQLEQRHFVVMLQRWFIRWRFLGRSRGGAPRASLHASSVTDGSGRSVPAARSTLPAAPSVRLVAPLRLTPTAAPHEHFASPLAREPTPSAYDDRAHRQGRPSAVLDEEETDPWIREHMLSDPRFALH
jgi:hypothetical protein